MRPPCPRRGSIRRFPLERREKTKDLKEVDRPPSAGLCKLRFGKPDAGS
jgi:hypothetical protein